MASWERVGKTSPALMSKVEPPRGPEPRSSRNPKPQLRVIVLPRKLNPKSPEPYNRAPPRRRELCATWSAGRVEKKTHPRPQSGKSVSEAIELIGPPSPTIQALSPKTHSGMTGLCGALALCECVRESKLETRTPNP